MSRVYTIEELNQMIDELRKDYEDDYLKAKARNDRIEELRLFYKIVGLDDFKLELNSPEPIVNVSENIQQSLNAITAQNIINNDL